MKLERRLDSLDALRGFDMLWIVGGAEVLRTLAEHPGGSFWRALAAQTHHVEWNGFRAWDGIFPLFLFLAGVSMPLSFAARRARGATGSDLARHALRRGLTLVLLGAIYNGLLAFDWDHQRWASVLGRIGLAWMLAAWIVLCFPGVRGQLLWCVGLLLFYWALLAWVPVPGLGHASLEPGKTLVDWVDRHFLPGRLHRGVRDPEGLLATLPAIATCLSGVLAGRHLSGGPASQRGGSRALILALAGVSSLFLGLLWNQVLPINKNLWTPSLVAVTSGGGAILLALFYWVIDVRGHTRWALPLRVLGLNAITVYLLERFIDFPTLAQLLLGQTVPSRLHPALFAALPLLLAWSLLWVLYRRGIFLRV